MKPNKLVLIGLDAPIVPRMLEFAEQGKLPAIRKIIETGTVAANCLVPLPTITPPNWMTIVTGAWPGTHQITCFNSYNPGDPLDQTHPAFDVRECQAEILWNKAADVGKKSIVLNYPTSWPPMLKSGYQIGGAGLSINEWRFGSTGDIGYHCTLSDEQIFSTEEYPEGTTIKLSKASGWGDREGLEAKLDLVYRVPSFKIEPVTWHLLVEASEGKEYDTIYVSKERNPSSAFAVLRQGEWSDIITDEFETEKGPKAASFALKLIELSPDGQTFKLYVTPLCALDGWSHPPELAGEITSEKGLPLPAPAFRSLNMDWIDIETYIDIVRFHDRWLADAATYVMRNKEWDLFFMQNHVPDFAYHCFSTRMDPLTNDDAQERERFAAAELGFYQSLDEMIGTMVEVAGEEALVILVSDHGAKATGTHVPMADILAEKGLLSLKESDDSNKRIVDWTKTKAVPQRACYIYVNLKGRDPDGIVEPGDYEAVRDEIISALYDYTDAKTGKKPFSLVLRREDARILGLYGDRVGDVVYAIAPEFGGQHGNHLPTAKWGIGSLEGLLIMAGPGIKKGFVLERNAWLTDVVPTICYLMDLPIPSDAEGAVLYQALEDPDAHLNERAKIEKNYQRLKRTYEADKQLTHTYTRIE